MNPKEIKLRKLIREELKLQLNEGNEYYRLSTKTIGDELYRVNRNIKSFYDSMKAGNDLELERIDGIISLLQKIKSSAKKFDQGTDLRSIPKQYR